MVRYKYWANNKVLTPIHVNSVLCVFVSIIPVATLENDILIHFRVSRIPPDLVLKNFFGIVRSSLSPDYSLYSSSFLCFH